MNRVVLPTALSTGVYASHSLVPPAAGPIAAAGNLGVGGPFLVWVILAGLVVSAVSATAGCCGRGA